ncbi:MAG TPA: chloride channel protein [Reyranella sp.]|nr:chloride channel protein [Reyranella sp.]
MRTLNGGVPRVGLVRLSLLALIVGLVTGFGAVLFRDLIGLIHNALFLGRFSVHYDANLFTHPSPWGPFVILVPVVGAIIVTFLVTNFAPEARGHGVPEVMDAIYYGGGIIRPVVAVVKSLASAFAIGSGAAVGREGPIIQIGSALGSTLGQIIRMPAGQRIILVAAGAGAGIAATFNTPIGGVMFTIELMMPEVSVSSFLPVAISTSVATFVGRYYFGLQSAFDVPHLAPLAVDLESALTLGLYGVLGAIVGVAATAFVRGLHLAEDLFDKIGSRYLRHIFGMLLVGVLIYVLFLQFDHYYVEGVGYATIQAILLGNLAAPGLLLLLFACKLFATSVSLGSGSSGGVFSPSLFLGATIGGAFASLLKAAHLGLSLDVASFAIVGMGAMVGGGTGAVMTAVTMIFEMTRNYDIILPMILAVAMSVGVRRLLSRENIYTMKLFRRGHAIPKALHANMFLVRRAVDVMDKDVVVMPADASFEDLLARPDNNGRLRHVVVEDNGRIVGVMRVNTSLRTPAPGTSSAVKLRDLASRQFTLVRENDVAFDVIRRLWRRGATMALVVPDSRAVPRAADVRGVISKEHVADSVANSINVYPAAG